MLKNRYLILDAPEEYAVQPRLDTPTSTPTSGGQVEKQLQGLYSTSNENIQRLVSSIGLKQLSVKEIMSAVNLKDRKNFMEYSLSPAINEGFVRLLYPESPRHPRQKYLLTVKGMMLLDRLKG